MSFDYAQFKDLLDNTKALQKEYDGFIRKFLLEMGMRALAKTKKRTPVQTGDLRNHWEVSAVFRRGDELIIYISNVMNYASYVENGHFQRARFVPGKWVNGVFVYDPTAKGDSNFKASGETGMFLKNKWIEGYFMAKVSMAEIERELPVRYESAFRAFYGGLDT